MPNNVWPAGVRFQLKTLAGQSPRLWHTAPGSVMNSPPTLWHWRLVLQSTPCGAIGRVQLGCGEAAWHRRCGHSRDCPLLSRIEWQRLGGTPILFCPKCGMPGVVAEPTVGKFARQDCLARQRHVTRMVAQIAPVPRDCLTLATRPFVDWEAKQNQDLAMVASACRSDVS
jgi:hypothetical protein